MRDPKTGRMIPTPIGEKFGAIIKREQMLSQQEGKSIEFAEEYRELLLSGKMTVTAFCKRWSGSNTQILYGSKDLTSWVQQLGLPPHTRLTPIELRTKGGHFRRQFEPRITSARSVWKRYYVDGDGYECDFDTFLTLSQLPCYYCGRLPHKTVNRGYHSNGKGKVFSTLQKEQGDFTYNGLDRLDSSKGHTPDNVVPCCYTCNWMKMALGLEEFLLHIERVYHHTRPLREKLTAAPEVALRSGV